MHCAPRDAQKEKIFVNQEEKRRRKGKGRETGEGEAGSLIDIRNGMRVLLHKDIMMGQSDCKRVVQTKGHNAQG